MGSRLLLVLLLTAVISYNGFAAETALSGSRISGLIAAIPQTSLPKGESSKEWVYDFWQFKGVLERRIRLRSRISPYLLKLSFGL